MTRGSVTKIGVLATILAGVAIAVTLFGPVSKGRAVEARQDQSGADVVVPVAKVMPANLSKDLTLTAEFKPFQDVDVMAKVAGYVKHIYVDVGDHVRQGQLLAVLEVPEMANEITKANASIDRSTAEVARAEDEVQRTQSAHDMSHLSYTRLAAVAKSKPGLIAQQELDDAHSRDLVAEAQVAAAKSNLSAAKEAVQVNRAEQARITTLYSYTHVTAPFDGVVTRRFADNGSMIQAGTASQTQAMPIVKLAENSLLRLILPVPESAVPKVHLGQIVDVDVPSLGRTFPGRVARFADEVDRSTRTMLTEVDVPNPHFTLVPGMYAQVQLSLDRRNQVSSIPLAAIDPGTEVSRVFVVTPTGTIEIRDVQLGIETADKAEVRSGLSNGELVIIGSRSGLKPGQHVSPKVTELAQPKANS